MPKIEVVGKEKESGWYFTVTISEGETRTEHQVTLSESDYQRLTDGRCEPAKLIEQSFEFLLEREPQGSILPKFDLTVISTYFPEYENDLKARIHL